LFDACGGARLQSKRKDSAVAAALRLYVGKPATADCFGAGYFGGRNLYIESIATTISLIIIQ
jgi:hypothetical protein